MQDKNSHLSKPGTDGQTKPKIIFFVTAIVLIIATVAIYNYSQLSSQPNKNLLNNSSILTDNGSDQTAVADEPKIKVSPESFNLGLVKYGDIPEKIIKVKNAGSKPLKILRLSTSCGCTQAFIEEKDKIIAPGKSVDMLVTFNPAVHKDDSDLGELTRIIYLKTNDPIEPEIEVELQANVIKADKFKIFKVTAKQWLFSPNIIKVKEGDYVQLKITSIDVTHGFNLLDFGIDETIKPGEETTINFLAEKKGIFEFFCSLPCGRGHGDMTGELIVE